MKHAKWLATKVWPGHGGRDPFWSTVTAEEFSQIVDNDSCLTGELLDRFCRINDIQDRPARLQILINIDDVERLIRKDKRRR